MKKTVAKKTGKQSGSSTEKKPEYYLIKSEPLTRIEMGKDMRFSIDDLMKEKNQTAEWDGVRNYLARNLMRSMKIGDKAFFYHSNCKPPGIVGQVEIVREAYPDFTQFDAKDPHYDPKSPKDNPRWDMVDVKFVRKTARMISLDELKTYPELKEMALFTKARLSVQPVTKTEWEFIHSIEHKI